MRSHLILNLLISTSLAGCVEIRDCERGRGGSVTQTLNLAGFNSLELYGDDIVHLSQGPVQEVRVEGQQNILDLIDLRVQHGNWKVKLRDCVGRHEPLVYHIAIPDIRALSVTGSGEIIGGDVFKVEELNLEVTGSGSIDIEANAEHIGSSITGSGQISIEGVSESSEVKIMGSGDYNGPEMVSGLTKVTITGSGDASVFAGVELDVNITGSGDVYYKGQPQINSSVTGSGRLIPMQ